MRHRTSKASTARTTSKARSRAPGGGQRTAFRREEPTIAPARVRRPPQRNARASYKSAGRSVFAWPASAPHTRSFRSLHHGFDGAAPAPSSLTAARSESKSTSSISSFLCSPSWASSRPSRDWHPSMTCRRRARLLTPQAVLTNSLRAELVDVHLSVSNGLQCAGLFSSSHHPAHGSLCCSMACSHRLAVCACECLALENEPSMYLAGHVLHRRLALHLALHPGALSKASSLNLSRRDSGSSRTSAMTRRRSSQRSSTMPS